MLEYLMTILLNINRDKYVFIRYLYQVIIECPIT